MAAKINQHGLGRAYTNSALLQAIASENELVHRCWTGPCALGHGLFPGAVHHRTRLNKRATYPFAEAQLSRFLSGHGNPSVAIPYPRDYRTADILMRRRAIPDCAGPTAVIYHGKLFWHAQTLLRQMPVR